MTPKILGDPLPIEALKLLPGWGALTKKDQALVEEETEALSEELLNFGRSKLAIGERLAKLQSVLEPRRMFRKFLSSYNFRRSTAYNHIAGFNHAKALLPPSVLERAMARNMNILGHKEAEPLGMYTHTIKRLPPPNSKDPKVIDAWLDSVEKGRQKERHRRARTVVEAQYDTETLMKEAYRYVNIRLEKIPNRGRARRAWLESLAGMLLTRVGVQSAVPIAPEAVPDDFEAVVGRPKSVASERG